MASPRTLTAGLLGLAALGVLGYFALDSRASLPVQGRGDLAQAPMNIQNTITPAFIMAVDDSGSMTFHNQLPAADGYACWSRANNRSPWGFFEDNQPRTETVSGGSCNYAYSYTGPRIGNTFFGIPPVDEYGFARSPDFNPAYFNPEITYLPWLNSDGTAYGASAGNPSGNASTTATRIDPRQAASINLTSDLFDANARSRFQAFTGMQLPAGTRFRLADTNSCGGLSNPWSGGWGTVGSWGHTMTTSCAVYIAYYPATFYLRERVPNARPTITAPGYAGLDAVRITDACGDGCHLWRFRIGSADTVALQNFANWYSFYGNRNRAMVAGMTRSMAEVSNMRVGYFTINNRTTVNMRDMRTDSDRVALFDSMLALPASGGTPNLPAVAHMGSQFNRTDSGAPIRNQCQRNGGMLFTDGFSNVAQTASAVTGLGAPFDPTPANTLAAIASRFYFDQSGAPPLRPDLLPHGKVPVPQQCDTLSPTSTEWKRLDCQRNLHMNFYGVTLGARGERFNPDQDQDPFADYAGWSSPKWPGYEANSRSTVDDIWHAAVNTRGEFINARTPVEIIDAMRRILSNVGAGTTPSGSGGLTGARIGAGSFSLTPSYTADNNGTDWFSRLRADTLTSDPATGVATWTSRWEAASVMPSPGARNIHFGRNSASGIAPVVRPFVAGSFTDTAANPAANRLCDNAQARCVGRGAGRSAITAAAGVPSEGLNATFAQAIAYLRGDQSLETANTNPTMPAFRRRTAVLGDVVNSSPVIASGFNDFGYRSLRDGASGSMDRFDYQTYLDSKASRTAMVYVGANDGMLHAFNGETGIETFAYIPASVLGHMGNLLFPYRSTHQNDQVFQHRYYVDGPIAVSDVYDGSAWKTALVGTTGAGARSVFALDVTDPSAFGASSVLWEINDTVADSAIANDIGHVLGKPIIVPVKVGGSVRWKAIFGNGYGSRSEAAVLFVVDMADGSVSRIRATESGAPSGPNGLGNIVVIDRKRTPDTGASTTGRDGYYDTVYAADQKGAIWKFDLTSATPVNQTVPVFVAKDASDVRQPILGGLEVAAGAGGGTMLFFGTGSFSFQNDPADRQVQSIYGVLDRSDGSPVATLGRTDLHQQTIQADTNGDRTLTASAMPADKKGWFLDLRMSGQAADGERVVGYPRLESGVLFIPTFTPDYDSGECTSGGLNRLYGLSTLSGAAAMSQVHRGTPTGDKPAEGTGAIRLETSGSAPVKDVMIAVSPRLGVLPSTATEDDVDDALAARCSMVISVAGAPPLYMRRPCGRQSWRQVR